MSFVPMVNIIPAGSVGIAQVEHFEVDKIASMWTSMRPGEFVPPGKYAKLRVGNTLMMSDTRHEHVTNYEALRMSTGDVLIAGLGLGMLLVPMLKKPSVNRVLVVEKHADVVALIETPLRAKFTKQENKKLSIVIGDIYEWRPAKAAKYDAIYFDIWADQSTDCLEDMTKLHKAFRKHLKPRGWMESWNRSFLKSRKRRGY